ncbi:MAG: small basic protein [Candidatus Omnitrophica bacterium]|nr:small basic protein [Candidatus Omnitrophota bacterium]
MSLHSSLRIDKASATQRTVQTRIERIKELMKKGLWKEDSAVTGLPKTKIIRIKAKKKVKAEGEGEAAAGAPTAAGAATGAEKPAAAAKPATAGKPAATGKPAAGASKK